MGVALGLLAAVLVRKLRLRRRPRHTAPAAGYRQHDRRTTATIAAWAALLISGGPRAMLTVWPDMPWRGVQTVLKELPDDRAVNLVCKDASGQTWSTFADSGWGPDNLAEATAGAGQTPARGSRHESSRSTPSANECRFREQPRTTPAAPRTHRKDALLAADLRGVKCRGHGHGTSRRLPRYAQLLWRSR